MFTMGPPLWGGDSDPLFGSVRALFHLDNSLTDNSTTGTVATQSNVTFSNSIVKPGFAFSGNFTHASNDASVTLPSSTALAVGSGDFTVEFWFYPTVLTSGLYFVGGDGATSDIWFYIASGATLGCHVLGQETFSVGPTFTVNTWHHVAVSKTGIVARVSLNGALVFSFTSNTGTSGATMLWTIGSTPLAGAGSGGRCYIDEFRLTVGAGRYPSTFTPPAAPFPNA